MNLFLPDTIMDLGSSLNASSTVIKGLACRPVTKTVLGTLDSLIKNIDQVSAALQRIKENYQDQILEHVEAQGGYVHRY